MSPTEFAARMTAADERFARALKSDDFREMRAALADKTGLLKVYFARQHHRALEQSVQTPSAR